MGLPRDPLPHSRTIPQSTDKPPPCVSTSWGISITGATRGRQAPTVWASQEKGSRPALTCLIGYVYTFVPQDEISETTGLLIRRLDWQSSRHSPCPRERARQVSAPISNSDLDSQEAACYPSIRGPTTPSFLKREDARCSGSGTGQQDRTSFCGAQPRQAGGYHPPVVPFLFSLYPSSLVTMSGLGRLCALFLTTPPHTCVLPTERGLCPSLTLVTRRALHRALWTRAQGGGLLGRHNVGVQGS